MNIIGGDINFEQLFISKDAVTARFGAFLLRAIVRRSYD
jgi:hypothetical protein